MFDKIVEKNSFINILKYIIVYSIFVFATLISLSHSRAKGIFPDLSMVMIFLLCNKWFQSEDNNIAYINLFLFGISRRQQSCSTLFLSVLVYQRTILLARFIFLIMLLCLKIIFWGSLHIVINV